jgi:nucleotide-binding universal stress UspA family protein
MATPETDRKLILVAVDGSPAAVAAVAAALEVASAMQAGVRFVHASSPLAEDLYDEFAVEGPPTEEVLSRDPVLAEACAQAREAGIEPEVELVAAEHGADLAAAIAGIASGSGASMVVTGSRGRGPVAGAVLGSVSGNLIKYAAVPVLVVHAADHAELRRRLALGESERAEVVG